MNLEEKIDRLTDLHIEVLKDILKGNTWEFIKERRQKDFDRLDYEQIMIEKAHRLTFDDQGNLIGAYPVSPIPTIHKITVAGVGTGYAMCAIDALGATHTFNAPVTIESQFANSNKPIQITLSARSIPEGDQVVSYDQLGYDSLQDLVAANSQLAIDACPAINFYKSPEEAPEGLTLLDFETAIKEAKAIFDWNGIRDHIASSMKSN